jgi:hypothetical protein
MPRPKGAKNVVDKNALLSENARLKSELERIKNVSVSTKPTDILESTDQNRSAAVDLKIKTPVKQVKPQKTKSAESLTKTYGCGNSLCNYESDSKFDTCPVCGVQNTWKQ